MTKVVVYLIVVLLTSVVNAATFTWSATNIPTLDGGISSAGSYVYLLDANVKGDGFDYGYATIKSALESGSTSEVLAASSNGALKEQATSYHFGPPMVTTSKAEGSFEMGVGVYNYYLVVFDKEMNSYIISDLAEIDYGGTGGPNKSFDFSSATWTSLSLSPGGGDEGVPEPTSGLLMIVGGALLALRRKQK